jgi:hypothetical protein
MDQQIIDKCNISRKACKEIKEVFVKHGLYELGADIREIERVAFPDSEELTKAKERCSELNLLFRMVELNIPDNVCWLIDNTMHLHRRKKGKFDLKDAAKLLAKHNELFDVD